MSRVLAFALALLVPVSALAQVSPFPFGATPPIVGLPAFNPSSPITPTSVGVPASTCAAPGIYLTTAPTNGMAFTATPSVIICVNGTAIVTTTSSAVTSTVPYVGPIGSAPAPTLTATGFTDTGFYWPNQAGATAWAGGGTPYIRFSSNGGVGLALSSAIPLGWSSDVINSSPDVSLSRGAADVARWADGDSMEFGSTAASSGLIRFPNGGTFNARDSGSNSRKVFELNSSNILEISQAAVPITLNGSVLLSNVLAISITAPTIASGFGTSPGIATNGTVSFTITVGTGGTATGGVITMPAAAGAWPVACENITSNASLTVGVTARTTTSVTLASYSRTTGLLTAFNASDQVDCIAMGR